MVFTLTTAIAVVILGASIEAPYSRRLAFSLVFCCEGSKIWARARREDLGSVLHSLAQPLRRGCASELLVVADLPRRRHRQTELDGVLDGHRTSFRMTRGRHVVTAVATISSRWSSASGWPSRREATASIRTSWTGVTRTCSRSSRAASQPSHAG